MKENLSINSAQIKTLFFENQKSKHASIRLFKTYKEKYIEMGYVSPHNFTLPKDWFFEQVRLDQGFSDNEIEILKKEHSLLNQKGEKII